MTQKRLAFIISRVLGPLPLLVVLWATTALNSGIGLQRALWVYPLILFVTLVVPYSLTTYLIFIKKAGDIEWQDIASRKKFLVPIGVYAVTSLFILSYFLTPGTIFHITLLFCAVMVATLAVYAFTNFKISGHVIVATATIANINLWYHPKYLWLFILLIPVIWARYVLKVHTLTEMICGFALAAGIFLLGLLLFGWPAIP